MINSLKGKVTFKEEKFIILETDSIGFRIFCSSLTLDKIPLNKEVKIFTRLFLEREELQLYGFANQKELELFDTLNNISGIGTKTALILSSFGSLEKLKKTIESGKFEVKGIGKKRLQRIILELTGKIKEIEKEKVKEKIEEKDESLDALRSLGFSQEEARVALLQLPPGIEDPQERIKSALKILGKR